MLAHAQAYRRITRASQHPRWFDSNQTLSKQSWVSSPALQPPPQPTTQNTRGREKTLGVRLVWLSVMTTQESTRWTLHTCTSYHPGEGLREASFIWEEGSRQFLDHFNQLVMNSQAPVKVYFIKWNLSLSESTRKHSRNLRLSSIPGETKWNERRDKAGGWSGLKSYIRQSACLCPWRFYLYHLCLQPSNAGELGLSSVQTKKYKSQYNPLVFIRSCLSPPEESKGVNDLIHLRNQEPQNQRGCPLHSSTRKSKEHWACHQGTPTIVAPARI